MLCSEPIRKSALKAVGDQPFKEWKKHLNVKKEMDLLFRKQIEKVC